MTELSSEIADARIVQIAALPQPRYYDPWNEAIGIALVEITATDGSVRSETFLLGGDATLVGAPDEIYYSAHYLGDRDRPFLERFKDAEDAEGDARETGRLRERLGEFEESPPA